MTLLTLLGLASMIFVAAFTWHTYRAGGGSRHALIEAWVNILLGFTLNWTANLVVIPLMSPGGHFTPVSNWWGGWIYTTISILRTYAIRRWAQGSLHLLVAWIERLVARMVPKRA